MHAADNLAGVHGVPVASVGRDHEAFHVGPGMRGLLPDEAPEPGQPEAAGRRYRVLERACVTAPVYTSKADISWPAAGLRSVQRMAWRAGAGGRNAGACTGVPL